VEESSEEELLSISVIIYFSYYLFQLLSISTQVEGYGVATNSRLLKIIGLFCRISSFYRALLQKRLMISRSLLIVATPYLTVSSQVATPPKFSNIEKLDFAESCSTNKFQMEDEVRVSFVPRS